jgi:magnesium-protoporphyrin O-methyltransferase
MNCCRSYEACFDQATADEDLKAYRRQGPGKTTRFLLESLKQAGVENLTLLDIGGGVGVIQHELLKAGVSRSTHVDASSAYLQASQAEATRLGHADRASYHYGDFVALVQEIPPADIVTLDRVICCYHDMPALVSLSAARANRLYGLVFPRDTWWIKLGVPIANLFLSLRREPFRVFAHSTVAVDALARQQGLTLQTYRRFFIWQVMVYSRGESISVGQSSGEDGYETER